jgi:hypothetical protein
MTEKRSKKRTGISENWETNGDQKLFATELGVDPAEEEPKFRDYHLAHGSLMADWAAAWRTWCRNAAKYARIRKPGPPLLQPIDEADPWGVIAWSHTLRDAEADILNGKPILTVGGMDVQSTALDVCSAAEIPQGWRGDLTPIADWLRDGIDPDLIVVAIGTSNRPERPNLRYYDKRVRDRAKRAA